MTHRSLRVLAVVLPAVAALPAAAQVPPDSVPPGDGHRTEATAPDHGADGSATHPYAALEVRDHSWSPAVAMALVIPRGSGADPEGLAGASWLLAQAAAAEAREALSSLPARLAVNVERGTTSFVLLTVPGHWRTALEVLDRAVFREPPGVLELERARAELLDQLGFEAGAPVRSFQAEMDRLLHGSSHPWARPARGYPATVEGVTAEILAGLHRRMYQRSEAALAVVGPVGREEVEAALPGPSGTAPDSAARTLPPAPSREVGVSFRVTRDVTSTWVGVAYPVSPGLPRTHAEFLSHVLEELLISDPPEPGVFGATVRLREAPDGPFLVVEAALFPGEEEGWRARVEQAVERLRNRPPEGAFFRLRRRRFRSARLLELGRPEQEALTVGRDLLGAGGARDLVREVAGLRSADLLRAAQALGPPRILVFGPDLSDRDGGDG